MKKYLVGFSCLLLLVVLAFPALAANQSRKSVTAPPEIERGVFVDYGYSSPPWYPDGCEDTVEHYKWAPRIHWAIPSVEILVNPTGSGFAPENVVDEVEKGFAAWDAASEPFGATVSRDDGVGPSLEVPDKVNTVSWGGIDGPGGIIAVTYYWYNVNTKELIDTDIVFDADEPWSISETVTSNEFDIWNIAAHEAGHTLVLQDLRSPKDGALTMHAYTWTGDDIKRTLGSGDELGIKAIYGE